MLLNVSHEHAQANHNNEAVCQLHDTYTRRGQIIFCQTMLRGCRVPNRASPSERLQLSPWPLKSKLAVIALRLVGTGRSTGRAHSCKRGCKQTDQIQSLLQWQLELCAFWRFECLLSRDQTGYRPLVCTDLAHKQFQPVASLWPVLDTIHVACTCVRVGVRHSDGLSSTCRT